MGGAFSGDKHQVTYASINLVSCLLAAGCSSLQLYLIHLLKLSSGHILLIWTMTWFQLFYDVSHFFGTVSIGSEGFFCIAKCCFLFGGICSSLTSNVVAYVSFHVVTFGHIIEVRSRYAIILFLIMLPAFADVTIYGMYCASSKYDFLGNIGSIGMYYYVRIGSIALNFIICGATAAQIYSKRYRQKRLTVIEQALRLLAVRILYYPIVQAISRSACSYYEAKYGFDFDPINPSRKQFISQIFFAVLTPSASYGYLAIFLLMQPRAYECFKCIISGKPFEVKVAPRASTRPTEFAHSQRESQYPSTAVHEIDNRNTYGSGANTPIDYHLVEMEEDELWNVVRLSMAANNGISISPIAEGKLISSITTM